MKETLPIAHCPLPMAPGGGSARSVVAGRQAAADRGFSLVELLVAMTLLTLIVVALMAVFSSTQRAFRASVTQTDVLEGSRAAIDLISTDLRNLTPCDGTSNYVVQNVGQSGLNFFVTNNGYLDFTISSYNYKPLMQSLVGSSSGALRTNSLQWFFVLGRNNTSWTGAGYIVNSSSSSPLYPLYRFYAQTNVSLNPVTLFYLFQTYINLSQWTNMSHVMDGVVHLNVRAYDPSGYWLTNGYAYWQSNRPQNIWFSAPFFGEVGFACYSNAVPAAVELQLGVLEDRALQRTASLGIPGSIGLSPAQLTYLQNQSGHVHLFRQRVTVPNVDPTAYP
jgi:prepilin-type N-terminal cleavage/methylation domain-containing protein